MFDNSITPPVGVVPAVSIVDTDNGRTVRRHNAGGGVFYELVISRQESNENKVVVTDRHLIQVSKIVNDVASGKPVRASVSLVVAYPRANFTTAVMIGLFESLFSFLSGSVEGSQNFAITTNLTRLFNGET